MRVKEDWSKVKYGDRVRFPAYQGQDGFEATLVSFAKIAASGSVYQAEFKDNVTLKLDGTPRKNSAKSRKVDVLYSSRTFEIIPSVKLPTTFGELTDEHIGMRFEIDGAPPMTGTYQAHNHESANYKYFENVMWRDERYEGKRAWDSKDGFTKDNGYGYFALPSTTVRYVGDNDVVDTDAKLAAYFNQELDAAFDATKGAHENAKRHSKNKLSYGEEIVLILKKLTE